MLLTDGQVMKTPVDSLVYCREMMSGDQDHLFLFLFSVSHPKTRTEKEQT